jgi:hypothetical protein
MRGEWGEDNIPKFNTYNSRRTPFMCRLVIGTPGPDRIPNMSASKLDLGIIAHDDVGLRGWGKPSSRTIDGVEKIEGSTILIKGQAADVYFKVT